jgi:hypothetical protein
MSHPGPDYIPYQDWAKQRRRRSLKLGVFGGFSGLVIAATLLYGVVSPIIRARSLGSNVLEAISRQGSYHLSIHLAEDSEAPPFKEHWVQGDHWRLARDNGKIVWRTRPPGPDYGLAPYLTIDYFTNTIYGHAKVLPSLNLLRRAGHSLTGATRGEGEILLEHLDPESLDGRQLLRIRCGNTLERFTWWIDTANNLPIKILLEERDAEGWRPLLVAKPSFGIEAIPKDPLTELNRAQEAELSTPVAVQDTLHGRIEVLSVEQNREGTVFLAARVPQTPGLGFRLEADPRTRYVTRWRAMSWPNDSSLVFYMAVPLRPNRSAEANAFFVGRLENGEEIARVSLTLPEKAPSLLSRFDYQNLASERTYGRVEAETKEIRSRGLRMRIAENGDDVQSLSSELPPEAARSRDAALIYVRDLHLEAIRAYRLNEIPSSVVGHLWLDIYHIYKQLRQPEKAKAAILCAYRETARANEDNYLTQNVLRALEDEELIDANGNVMDD